MPLRELPSPGFDRLRHTLQAVAPMTPATFPSSPTPMFDQQITVPNPTLWYPNNSTFGKPYLYRVYHIVSVNGVVVDAATSPLGIRTLTWDANFPYLNGHAHYLWGGSGRYDYPALGSSVPTEQEWRDLAQFAASGGNLWGPATPPAAKSCGSRRCLRHHDRPAQRRRGRRVYQPLRHP